MRRRHIIKGITIFVAVLLIVFMLNIKVTTRQGVNYVVREIKIPLYIKIFEFIDRDYQYKVLLKEIIKGCKDDEGKILAIFNWTHENIKQNIPENYPIVDDHVWHIIVKGYGVNDQLSDVFTTLCNYAGTSAFYTWVYSDDKKSALPLAVVEINDRWFIFYPYRGAYFENRRGELADIEDIKANDWVVVENNDEGPTINYADYFGNLSMPKEHNLTKGSIQSPINRLIFEIKKWIRK